jgi:lysophospholipase L1-like esterase
VRLVDLQAHVCPAGPTQRCQPWRTDGLHFDGDGARTVASWLVERVLDPASG